MVKQREKVRDFFNVSAYRYRQKGQKNSHQYFDHRLQIALRELPPTAASILDIGCGTGLLYDALKDRSVQQHYFGVDASTEMLKRSQIPIKQREEGFFFDVIPNQSAQFDYVFALGFTTYLSANQIQPFYQELAKLLRPGGKAIISYTHRYSFDYYWRQLINKTLGRWLPADRSLGRNFQVYASHPSTVVKEATLAGLKTEDIHWMPAVCPFTAQLYTSKKWTPFCRPDFIMVFSVSRSNR